MRIDRVGIKRASFHTASERYVYVMLQGDAYDEGPGGMLSNTMYGTIDVVMSVGRWSTPDT